MKYLFQIGSLVVFLALTANALQAQHCPYDMLCILVLNVHAGDTAEVIPNLKITLLDENNEVIQQERWNTESCIYDKSPIQFWQNPKRIKRRQSIDNNSPYYASKIRYWFAKNNYVLVDACGFSGKFIQIEDMDGCANGGDFDKIIVSLEEMHEYHLCTGFSNWSLPQKYQTKQRQFVAGFQPMSIQLWEK